VRVELFVAPDCRHAGAARELVARCVEQAAVAVSVREHVGDFASPTILVDGMDVMTGADGSPASQACRLDLPTQQRLLAALAGGAA
jgi:hypothetical protein